MCACEVEKVCEADGARQVGCHAVVQSSRGVCTCLFSDGVRCPVLLARLFVCMLKCLGAVRPSASLICADSFVIGAVDQVGGGGQLMVHPCRMKNGEIIEVEDVCMCVPALMCGSGWG